MYIELHDVANNFHRTFQVKRLRWETDKTGDDLAELLLQRIGDEFGYRRHLRNVQPKSSQFGYMSLCLVRPGCLPDMPSAESIIECTIRATTDQWVTEEGDIVDMPNAVVYDIRASVADENGPPFFSGLYALCVAH